MNLPAVEVKISFPPSGSTLSAGGETFVAGCIKPAGSKLSINGKEIVPYRTGSFVYMQKIKPGKNILDIKSGKYKTQHSFILKPPAKKSTKAQITPLFPNSSAGVITGKTFRVSCKAPPGSNPQIKIGERTIDLRQGTEKDLWTTPLKFYCPLQNLPVTFSAKGLPDVNTGVMSALSNMETFKVSGELFSTRARSEPDSGETIAFLMPDDIVVCNGFHGNHRSMVINGKECFINSKYLKHTKLPQGISPNPQPADISAGFGPHPPKGKKPEQLLIALDAGHGGSDSGAIGPSGIKEKEITLRQIRLLEKVLKEAGYKTLLTRRSDTYVGLYDRVRSAYGKKADAFISIHYNSCPSQQDPRKKRYIATYCWNDIGKALAEKVNPEIVQISPARNAGVQHGNFAVCRNPAIPSILIELDFITTPEGEELIQTADFQTKAAEAILRGLKKWHK